MVLSVVLFGLLSPNLSLHFCNGHFAGFGLQTISGFESGSISSCSKTCDSSEQPKGCCEDVVIDIDQDIDAPFAMSADLEIRAMVMIVAPVQILTDHILLSEVTTIHVDRGPPPKPSGQHLRILHQSFLC